MAARAIALGRVVEQREPARLLRRQPDAAGQVVVVLAAVGIEEAGLLLVGGQRLADGGDRPLAVVERGRAEQARDLGGVGCAAQPCGDVARARIGHLVGREQGHARLVALQVDAAVPGEAAGRPVVDAGVAFVLGVVVVLGERRHVLQIGERGHRAQAGLSHVLAAELHVARCWPGRTRGRGRGRWRTPSARRPTASCRRTSSRRAPSAHAPAHRPARGSCRRRPRRRRRRRGRRRGRGRRGGEEVSCWSSRRACLSPVTECRQWSSPQAFTQRSWRRA